MEKVLKIKSNLDKLNSQELDDWNSISTNINEIIYDAVADGKITVNMESVSSFAVDLTNRITTIFRAYLQSEENNI